MWPCVYRYSCLRTSAADTGAPGFREHASPSSRRRSPALPLGLSARLASSYWRRSSPGPCRHNDRCGPSHSWTLAITTVGDEVASETADGILAGSPIPNYERAPREGDRSRPAAGRNQRAGTDLERGHPRRTNIDYRAIVKANPRRALHGARTAELPAVKVDDFPLAAVVEPDAVALSELLTCHMIIVRQQGERPSRFARRPSPPESASWPTPGRFRSVSGAPQVGRRIGDCALARHRDRGRSLRPAPP